jgi:GT2 family glycosyltransferase
MKSKQRLSSRRKVTRVRQSAGRRISQSANRIKARNARTRQHRRPGSGIRRLLIKRGSRLRKRVGHRAYELGHHAGYPIGYSAGYGAGIIAGKSRSAPFQGTSIIIPTFNQGSLLRDCIESIGAYTPEPHEIIVIDNASTDGTADYLASMAGKLRYRINTDNMGFAGGVNQGLKMAMGTKLLLLNNDTVVTKNWLANLHRCLDSDGRIGLVGPMTNYISGEQLVATSYSNIEEMHRFAERFNQPNPLSWNKTARITGFCLLFRRELLERLGFFDEGFEIGNCEDDDFCLRVRLLGQELVIAGDVFIHHVGSVSMKALGSEMGEVYGRNLDFYAQKWGSVDQLTAEMVSMNSGGEQRSMMHFYPNQAVVRGERGSVYVLQAGVRRYLIGAENLQSPAVRLSHMELGSCAFGDNMDLGELEKYWYLAAYRGAGLQEGMLVQLQGGQLLRYEAGKLRRIISERAASVWGFDKQTPFMLDNSTFEGLPLGLPIIAPISIKADNI